MIRVGFPLRALGLPAAMLLLVAPVSAQSIAGCKVAYVNGAQVLQSTPGYAQADSIFKREMQIYSTEIAKLQGDLQAAAAKFEETSVMLSATNRAAERKKLSDQQDALEKRQQDIQTKAQDRRTQLVSPIESRITAVIEGIRAENNCAMIFDVAVDGNAILAADKSLDLTAKVIERLRGATAPAAKP
ncbi:MAG: OmpH family outer membrane protein [Gemmatimonadetes bacterium]|jgi:Skp family chaperone for outer membrane proteins|nr:OmpH family outer membrane protein [Gemmatimonadota bacterium]MBK9549562.1 OmpH family outer membrane protein [Gemmatimonadota bacterium]MBP6443813.1 OmpH family outer membrane protein [Gemmatimonadales bacterium]MBP6571705.1 OmpH family outer membrane protein [Gemmatimonadales bacterium]MBP9897661.1 OmpH family outer membrane protein [Gemmatimonadales bacterium]